VARAAPGSAPAKEEPEAGHSELGSIRHDIAFIKELLTQWSASLSLSAPFSSSLRAEAAEFLPTFGPLPYVDELFFVDDQNYQTLGPLGSPAFSPTSEPDLPDREEPRHVLADLPLPDDLRPGRVDPRPELADPARSDAVRPGRDEPQYDWDDLSDDGALRPAPNQPRLEQDSCCAAADSPLDSRSMTEHPKWNDFDLFCSRLHSNVRYDLTLDNFKNFLGEYGPTVPFDAISSGSFEADTLLDSPFCQIDECIPQVVRAMRSCVWALREGVYFGEHPGDDPSVMAARGKFVLSHLVTGGPGGSESTDLEGVAALLERSIGLAFRLLRQLPDQSSARLKEFLSYALREKEKCSGPALLELNAVLEALLSQALDGMGA